MKTYELVCSICGRPFEGGGEERSCPQCGGQLEPVLDLASRKAEAAEAVANGCRRGVWDYRPLLPVEGLTAVVTLGEGHTPLVDSERLARRLDVGQMLLKDETKNPSGTYKDRFATLALSIEASRGTEAVCLGSAGNAASAIAAYSAKAGMPCYVFLPPGATAERAFQVRTYGARLMQVGATIDDCIAAALACQERFGWKTMTTNMLTNPLPSEGYKTVAYELVRQMDYAVPDWIVVPVGGGALLNKIAKGYEELQQLGLIEKTPRFAAVQAAGCAPLVDAFQRGLSEPEVWPGVPETAAFAIADVRTYDGATTLHILRTSGGTAVAVPDDEILQAARWIARSEAILAEPASAATVAAVQRLRAKNLIKASDRVVCILSGNGMRDLRLLGQDGTEPPRFEKWDLDSVARWVAAHPHKQDVRSGRL